MISEASEISMAAPFKCPLSKCSETISSSLLLSHFIKIHQKDDVDIKEIRENEKTSLLVSVSRDFLELDRNICLGILVYEGKPENLRENHSNAMLSREFVNYDRHIPILIMACRGNYVKMYEEDADAFIDPDADFLAVWLVMPETSVKQKILATVTVHNEELTKSLSSLMQVRNASNSQDVREFMETETDFLIVNQGFLEEISTNGNIFVEIAITESLM